MNLNKTTTARGFGIVTFKDRYDAECSIQESSLATESAIWFGVKDPNPQVMASQARQYGNDPRTYTIGRCCNNK